LIGAIFISFDKEFQQVSDNIAHHSTEIDWAANAANIEEAKRARGFEEAVRQGNFALFVTLSAQYIQVRVVLVFNNGCLQQMFRMTYIGTKMIA